MRCFRLLFLFMVTVSSLPAQFYQLRNFNVKDGLPGSQIYDMLQDRKGYMWFAGDMGVSRFDGYEFKNYSVENGLPNNSVVILHEDPKGRIWFMTFTSELAYFFEGKIYVAPCSKKLNSFKSRGCLGTSFYVDEGDTIWIGTSLVGLVKILPGWKENDIHLMEMTKRGVYICNFNNKGFVFGFRRSNEKTLSVSVFNSLIFDYKIDLNPGFKHRNKIEALPGNSWMISSYSELIHFNRSGILSQKNVGDDVITLKFENQTLFAGTYNGLRYYKNGSLKESRSIPRLDNKSVTSIFTDHEKGLWFCTDGQGVYYLPYPGLQYYSYEDGLSESKITSATFLNSSVVLGHQNSMISILNNDKINSFRINKKNLSIRNSIVSVVPYNEHEFIVCSAKEIFRMNLDGKIVPGSYQQRRGVKKLIKSRSGGYWLIENMSLTELDLNLKKIKEIPIKNYTDNLFEGSGNNIWVCSINGLWRYQPETGLQQMSSQNALYSARVLDLVESRYGELLMATRGSGVIVKNTDSVYTIGKKHGLTSNMCCSIFKESDDTIWVGTNGGLNRLIRIPKYGYKISGFTMANGLLSNEVNGIIKFNGKLWLIHNNGITVMNPKTLTTNTSPPPVYIVSALVNAAPLSRYDSAHVYEFSYYQKELDINFIGLSYKNAGKTEYKYKLFGLDSNWNYTKNTNAKYQNVPPGYYRFSVFAGNNDSIWSARPASISFKINKAWWQTWWFYLFIFASIMAIISVIFRIRLGILKKRNDEETAVQRSIDSSELKALRAQMNPHFIFNSLNSIQKFIIMNDQDNAGNYLGKFSRLIRNILEQSSEKWIGLEEDLQTVNLYLELEALRYNFKYSINIYGDLDASKIYVLPMILQPYIENAIWHGLVHKEGEKNLNIVIKKISRNIIEFVIEDNGIGRKRAMELRTTHSPGHKSMGIDLTQSRVNLSNASGNKKYSIEIIDKFENNSQPTGTKVIVLLYEQNH